mmetsp:Transcript_26915/g.68253  ORF Transcript_26915/g.68253 Transcript_26915/m.68253 type:complete len:254 (+) Transcript_26915:409-1170(+)
MRSEGEDSARSEGDELVGGGAERAGGVDHVVDNDAVRALDVAHQVRRAHLARPLALLDDHGEATHDALRLEALLEHLGARDAARVRRDHHAVLQVARAEVRDGDRPGEEVVHGRARPEEALDLAAVQVDAADAVDAHGLHHARDVRSRDGHARAVLAVLPRVPVVGHDRCDARGGGAAQRGSTQQELHQVVVDRRAGGLYDVHVRVAHVLEDLDAHLAVGEARDGRGRERHAEAGRDLLSELRVAVACQQLHR